MVVLKMTSACAGFGVLLGIYLSAAYKGKAWALLPAAVMSGGIDPPSIGALIPHIWHNSRRFLACVAILAVTLGLLVVFALFQEQLAPRSPLWFHPPRASNYDAQFFAWNDASSALPTRPFAVLRYFTVYNLSISDIAHSRAGKRHRGDILFVVKEKMSLTVVIWLAAWAVCLWSLIRYRACKNPVIVCVLAGLATQYLFYLAYSTETFLYSPNWTPMMLLLLALSLRPVLKEYPRLSPCILPGLLVLAVLQAFQHWHCLSTMVALVQ